MPVTSCMLCHQPLVLTADDLRNRQVPTVGEECREWLADGLGIQGEGILFNLEQMIMIACLQSAVEDGYIGAAARKVADARIATALQELNQRYQAKTRDNIAAAKAHQASLVEDTLDFPAIKVEQEPPQVIPTEPKA